MQESLLELRTEIEAMRGASRDEALSRAVQMRSAREARIEAVLGEWMPLPENMPPPPGGREFLRVRRREGHGTRVLERGMGVLRAGTGGTEKSCSPAKAEALCPTATVQAPALPTHFSCPCCCTPHPSPPRPPTRLPPETFP